MESVPPNGQPLPPSSPGDDRPETRPDRELGVFERLSDAVGRTPLVRLNRSLRVRGPQGTQVFAKLEYLNPMGSIKDRVARHMVESALESGELRRGGCVVEASSGNTAMGLAMMSIDHGTRFRAVVRSCTSPEKIAALEALGAEIILVDGNLPPADPESYNRKAGVIAEADSSIYFPDQHNNRLNNEAHYATTGPEIWEQMRGRIDVVVAGIGTGGTISGVARYLKERDPRVRVVAVDVEGSVFTEYFRTGRCPEPARYSLEGLGDEEIIGCPEFELIDEMVQVSDQEAFWGARRLALREAMLVGGSSGAALWGVEQVLGGLERAARVVTILPDSGSRYLATIYNDDWLTERGFRLGCGDDGTT